VGNNYLDLGMNKSGFVHTLPSGRLSFVQFTNIIRTTRILITRWLSHINIFFKKTMKESILNI
jgi:hypothetical protein